MYTAAATDPLAGAPYRPVPTPTLFFDETEYKLAVASEADRTAYDLRCRVLSAYVMLLIAE